MKSPWLAGEEGLQADQIKPVRDNVSAAGLGIQLIKQAENGKKKQKGLSRACPQLQTLLLGSSGGSINSRLIQQSVLALVLGLVLVLGSGAGIESWGEALLC